MFCNYEKISCEILNTAIGPDHAKIAIAELKLTLRKYGKGNRLPQPNQGCPGQLQTGVRRAMSRKY